MNTAPRPTSSVTDEEYQAALATWADAEKECIRIGLELAKANGREQDAYHRLKQIRATIAAEALEIINGR